MPIKIKKLKRAKRYNYGKNRKRLNKSQKNTGTIKHQEANKLWVDGKSVADNLHHMGISADPNKTLGIPSAKQDQLNKIKFVNGFTVEDADEEMQVQETPAAPSRSALKALRRRQPHQHIAKMMEKDAKTFRGVALRLPKPVVAHLSYMLDKHGLNYKAMSLDPKNLDQETWKQLRAKIRKFINIYEQFEEYLTARNLDREKLGWEEYETDDEL